MEDMARNAFTKTEVRKKNSATRKMTQIVMVNRRIRSLYFFQKFVSIGVFPFTRPVYHRNFRISSVQQLYEG